MIRKTYILSLLLLFPIFVSANDNPFLPMVGKSYIEYHDGYRREIDKLSDSLSRAKVNVWIKEAAATDQTKEWLLLAKYIDLNTHFHALRRWKNTLVTEKQAAAYMNDVLAIARAAEREGFPHVKLMILHDIAGICRGQLLDYRLAFEYYFELSAELDKISTRDFPPRPWIYKDIASLYYQFDDYANAMVYYTKVIDDPDAADNYYSPRAGAYHGLGLCYRNGYKDYGKSDEYFRAIYTLPEAPQDVWGGITDGSLGYNKFLQGDYAAALPLLLSSVERITAIYDFQYASDRAVNVADIYLKEGKLPEAKKYIDIALDWLRRGDCTEKGPELYSVISKYYARIGNLPEATACFDSVRIATERDHKRFNGQVLRLVEQKLHSAEQQLKEEELQAAHFRVYTLFVICGLLVIALLVWIYYYRLLAKKNRAIVAQILEQNKMAQRRDAMHRVSTDQASENQNLFDRLNEYLYDNKIFLNETVNRAEITRTLNTNDKYLQNAIRDCADITFTEYINSLRLQHACLLLGDRANCKTIDAIATDCGLGNRITFYRLFIRKYGISPSEFRKNAQ
ncbi:MAG: helix-turn-helix domain-containing protein [Paludibacter sp.]|nr:helix-turn-helix domain-containing protein [Paludibacter sp.]